MKKSLIALAVLAASGAAMAQSSVTLYGRLDASLGQTGAVPVASLSQTGINSSAKNTTYWGMKGSEDLGGGLKANFVLQSGFAIDTGVGNAGLFEREAHVGLAGGFGEVALGRQYTSFHSSMGDTDMLWDNNFAVAGTVSGVGVAAQGVRASNSIRYDSPKFGGVTASVTLGFGEDKGATGNVGDATNHVSFNVKYAAGPVMVTYAHQENKLAQANLTTAQVTNKYDIIGGTYDFGAAKINAAYNKAKDGTQNDTEYQVGVTVPMGAFAFGVGYSAGKSTASGLADLESKGFAMSAQYDLSKRTSLYAGYKATEVETNRAATNTAKSKTFAAGVVHLF